MDGMPRPRTAKFADDPDEDLLGYMAMRDDDPDDAREAGAEFFERHKGFLYGLIKSRRLGRLIGGDEEAKDLVIEAFAIAYNRAETYEPCGSPDRERQRRRCRNWLVGIAKRIIREAFSRRLSVVAEEAIDDDLPEIAIEVDEESEVVRVIGEALDALTEREQDVVRTTIEYFRPGEKHQRLSNAAASALAAQLGTTTQNVRAIRSRAYRKIRSCVEEHLKGRQKGKR